MTGQVPETGDPFLRDFLYVDAQRVRSLLAQLANGYPTAIQSSVAKQTQANVSLQIFGGVKGDTSTETSSRSVEDLALATLEDAAEEVGFLRDVTEFATKAKYWKRGTIGKFLKAGQVIRVTAPTSILDPSSVKASLGKWNALNFDGAVNSPDKEFEAALQLVDAMYGTAVVVRSFPAGIDEASCHFVGTLEAPEQSFDRSTLLTRLGVAPQQWTMVAQIARITSSSTTPANTRLLDLAKLINSEQAVDRVALEQFLRQTVAELEEAGLAESPVYPAISVVPLAIYRVVEKYNPTDLHFVEDSSG